MTSPAADSNDPRGIRFGVGVLVLIFVAGLAIVVYMENEPAVSRFLRSARAHADSLVTPQLREARKRAHLALHVKNCIILEGDLDSVGRAPIAKCLVDRYDLQPRQADEAIGAFTAGTIRP